jgi:acyl-CoA thioester hydrolase
MTELTLIVRRDRATLSRKGALAFGTPTSVNPLRGTMTMRPVLPTYAQIRALPCLLEKPVDDRFEDVNGHVSTTGQLAIHESAAWSFLADIGVNYADGATSGVMDLEYHLRFVAEVMAGDTFAVHARLIDRAPRRLHALWFLIDVTHERIANTFEWVAAHVDLEARKAAPFPPGVATKLDAMIASDATLDWPAPVCGAMGLS